MHAVARSTKKAFGTDFSDRVAGSFSLSSFKSSSSLRSASAARFSLPSFKCSSWLPQWSSSLRNFHLQCSSFDSQGEPNPCLPLCERQPAHASSVEELLKWRSWAQDMAFSVGDKYCIADGGPDSDDLLRELEWMLEDCVSHVLMPSPTPHMPNGSMDNRSKQTNSMLSPFLPAKRSDRPSGMPAEMSSPMRNGLCCDSQRILTWQNIKNSKPSDFQKVVCLRASLGELSTLWTDRVQHRRPFQYVVGCAHWRDFVLFVKEGVLIPRPETEQMIDIAEEIIAGDLKLSKGLWADLGTGSGALAIGLASISHLEGNVVAVDLSDEALFIASINIQKYGFQNKIKLLKGSWFSPLEDLKGKLAGVVSNPPYIPSSHIATLQAEVGQYEPRSALDGGQQGIDDLTVICEEASWALQSGGYVILETNGGDQAATVANFLDSMPGGHFCDVQLIKDLAGIARFVRAMHI